MLARWQKLTVMLLTLCLWWGGCWPAFSEETPGFISPLEQNAVLTGVVSHADYVIGTGDSLYVEDAQMGQLFKEGKVLPDGSVTLPLVGKVVLAGLTVPEAKRLLNEKYGQFYTQPNISIRLINQRPVRVYVTGAVAHPGVYVSGKSIKAGNEGGAELGNYASLYWFYRLYLTDALLLAGGLEYNANVTDIRIKRRFPRPSVIHINLLDLFNQDNVRQDLSLRDQDVIEVDALPTEQLVMDAERESFLQSNVGLTVFRVNVVGAVNRPGVYDVKAQDNVLTAISEAGGFAEMAEKDKVYLIRSTPSGQVIKRELNMTDKRLIGKKPFEQWAALLPNDVIYVDESKARQAALAGKDLLDRASTAALFPIFNNLFRKDTGGGSK